jgi:tetratricopeptide (TPR) repeat protein
MPIFLGDACARKDRPGNRCYNRHRAEPVEAAAYNKLVSIRPGPQLAPTSKRSSTRSLCSEPSGSVWSVLANAYGQQADFEQAKTFYQRAIQSDPTLTQAYIGLAELDLLMSNDRASALNFYQQAVQSDPGSIRAYSEVANFYLAQGQLETALTAYQDLVTEFPNQAVGYLGLNNVYRRMGNLSQALEILRQAVENNPISAEIYMAYADQLRLETEHRQRCTQGLQIDPVW